MVHYRIQALDSHAHSKSKYTLIKICPQVNSKSNVYLGGRQKIMFRVGSKVTGPAPLPLAEKIVIAVLTDVSDQLGSSALTC